MIRNPILIVLLLLVLSFPSFALRPISTDTTGTTSRDHFKFEAGYNSDTIYSLTSTSMVASAKYGILDNMEMSIGASYPSTVNTKGRGPVTLSAKYRFNEKTGAVPSFGMKGSVDMLENADSTICLTGIMTDKLNDLTFHLNVGVVTVASTTGMTYGCAVQYPLNGNFNLIGEINGGNKNSVATAKGLVGGQYKIKDNVTLDCGIRIALNDITPTGFTFGLTAQL